MTENHDENRDNVMNEPASDNILKIERHVTDLKTWSNKLRHENSRLNVALCICCFFLAFISGVVFEATDDYLKTVLYR